MTKTRRDRIQSHNDTNYIRKVFHAKHLGLNITQSSLDDLDSRLVALFDELARGSVNLLRVKPARCRTSTLSVREFDTYIELNMAPEMAKAMHKRARDTVVKFSTHNSKTQEVTATNDEPMEF